MERIILCVLVIILTVMSYYAGLSDGKKQIRQAILENRIQIDTNVSTNTVRTVTVKE